MAQCKDCIHYCVCDRFTAPNETYPEVGGCRLFQNTVDIPPCKIGDTVWAIRDFHKTKKIMSGKVSEMYYVGEEMKLCIVVKHIARGSWLQDVFPTYKEAEKRLIEWQTKR